ncbi:MAG: IclR family transcriptional regulator [Desulfarculaceae bacterium]|jgi:DNA-binding IclR family transcriptional regulator
MKKSAKSGSVPQENTPPRGAQSLSRAITLLKAVARHNETGARLSQMAREEGLHVATAQRLLKVLVAEELVTHDPVTKLYHLGLELFHLGQSAHQFTIRDIFRPLLEKIAGQTGDTVFLLVRSGLDMLCIDRVSGEYPIRTILVDVGARRPLGIGAGSLSLIAFLPDDEFEAVLRVNEDRYPHYKNLTSDDIREMARVARTRGYVLSDGLFHEDAVSVGIPMFGAKGKPVAAITVSAIRPRMDEKRRQEIYRLVKEIAQPEALRIQA